MTDAARPSSPATFTAGVHAWGRPRFAGAANAPAAGTSGLPERWASVLSGGPATLAQVEGPFAVARFEGDDVATLAVDRFAICSLCYRLIDGRVHVSDRADALAQLEPRAEVDAQAVFDYLYFHVIPSPRTIYRGVFRVPPAHVVRIERGSVTVKPYWVPRFQAVARADFDALAAEFRDCVAQAVQRELDGGKPGCFLSGGTDSSTVAGMIGRAAGRSAATYSIGFEAEGYDEMQFARIAARRFGTEHHEYYVTPDDLVRSVPAVAAHYDQPFGNSSVLPAYYCARMAREDGVSRLLAGDGGDELFGGNSRYAMQRVFGVYAQVPSLLRGGLLEPVLLRTPVGRLPLARKGRGYIEQARVPLPDRMQMYNLLRRLGIDEVLEPGFRAAVDTDDPLRQQREVWRSVPDAGDLNRMLAYDWRYTLAEADLPKVCGSTRLAGVEVGFPLLAVPLVDFSMKLPDAYKLKGLKLRWFFKEALRGFLPDEILTKRKQGFGLPFGVWATRHAALRGMATDALHSLSRRGIVRPEFVKTLVGDLLNQHPGYYGEMVWILMMLEQWLQQHAPDCRFH